MGGWNGMLNGGWAEAICIMAHPPLQLHPKVPCPWAIKYGNRHHSTENHHEHHTSRM